MKASHIIILLIVLIVIFGAAKLPDIAKSLGQSAKVLKKEMKELQDDVPPEGSTQQVAQPPVNPQTQGTDQSPAAPQNPTQPGQGQNPPVA